MILSISEKSNSREFDPIYETASLFLNPMRSITCSVVRNSEKSPAKRVTHRPNSRCDCRSIDRADYVASLVFSHGLYLLCRVSSAYTRARTHACTHARMHAHVDKCKSDVDVTRPYMASP